MASPPSVSKISTDSFTGDWGSDSQGLASTLNKFMSDSQSLFSGQLGRVTNLGYMAWSFKVSVPDVWQVPSLINSWTYFGAPEATAGYMKQADGTVHLKGGLHNGTLGSPAFTLPASYAPTERRQCVCYYFNGTTAVPGLVYVEPNGDVKPAGSSNFYVSLAGIVFPCSDLSPYIPPCFPIAKQCTLPTGIAQSIEIESIQDITPGQAPIYGIPKDVAWRNAGGRVVIDNIPGLLPNRTYLVTAVAKPKG